MSPVLAGSTFIRPHINLGYEPDRPGGVESLPELIEFASQKNPDHIFGVQHRVGENVTPHDMTFSQLQSAVEQASTWLVHSGLTSGRTRREDKISPVGIFLGSDIAIFIYMAALLRIGTPVLLLSARLTPVAVAHLLNETSPSCVLASPQVSHSTKETIALLEAEADGSPVPKFVDALGYEELFNPDPSQQGLEIPPKYTDFAREDLDAIIMHSSGTTGLPKPVYHSQAYVLVYAACHRLPEQREPFRFNVSTLPLYHGFGLLAPALSLSIGMPFILPPATIIPTGKTTLAALQSTGARYMFSVPSILEDMLRLPGGAGLEALKDLEIVATGGAPMKESVGSELVAGGVNLLNHWGATEIGAIAPIEKIPRGYDWHYLMPRNDLGFKIVPLDDGSDSYRLVVRAPGWKEPFVIQDCLVVHPHDHKQYRILGRADDLLVLATGEKVRPTNLEIAVSEHPDVKDVLAFGEGQLSLGLLVELVAGSVPTDLDLSENMEALLTSIEPYLERGNSLTDKHGKVTKEMIIFTRETSKPLRRTDKGSLARKANLAAFDAEIRACYERADVVKAAPLPLPGVDDGNALLGFIRSLVRDITCNNDSADETDFFEAGMDSLQASRLRRSLLNSLRATSGLYQPVEDLDPDFCFENSSVHKLYHAVSRIMSGTYSHRAYGETKESRRIAAMEDMVEKYREELWTYSRLAAYVRISRRSRRPAPEQGSVVLLTGSTGSLGCFLLAKLANDPTVSKVICLNRPQSGSITLRERQMDLMMKRGASMSYAAWEKVVLHGADLSKPDFGLGEESFGQLLRVTHVIHNAWPVNFNRNLSSFEPHVKGLCNLIRLALLSSGARPLGSPATRFLFASSISVVGRYSLLHPKGPFEIPETALDAVHTSEFGYPEAKWVCEMVLLAAVEFYGDAASVEEPLIQGSSVRIGQMTGPEGSGAWNESEHLPMIVHTSKVLKALPSLHGSLAWLPVNRAADVITELLFSKGFKPFYHVENPSRQSWDGILYTLACILGEPGKPLPIIPFPKWLDRVRSLGDDSHNSAYKLISFLETDFMNLANGTTIMRTSAARFDSPTMVKSTSVDRKHLEEYVAYWKTVGVI